MLKCCECKKRDSENAVGFSSLNDLEAHLVEEHFSNCCIYECPICQYTRFPTEMFPCSTLSRLKQSVDPAKLDGRSLIHSSLNKSVFELANESPLTPGNLLSTSNAPADKLEKITPSVTSSINKSCTVFRSFTNTPSTSKKSLNTTPGNSITELSEIAQFTTRTSQQGGIILISPTGYEYRKSKKAANLKGEYVYRCNTMLGYRDCKARVSVDICTGVGTLKDQQHSHLPPTDFHSKSNGPLSVAEMFLPGRRSKRGNKKISKNQHGADDYYDQEDYNNYEEDDYSEPLPKKDVKYEDDHPNMSSVNDFILSIAQQK
uniref:FLYWCH-type domain-containing protein n=1 Tax=Ditylenchus dipsaci TaxID=166011 RepID=A0A915DZ00_9BILA